MGNSIPKRYYSHNDKPYNNINMKKIACIAFVVCIISLFISCDNNEKYYLSGYTKDNVNIGKSFEQSCVGIDDCTIDIMANLKVPSTVKGFVGDKMLYENGHFFIMDQEHNKTVFVFDSLGNYVSKLGCLGRADNEYLDKPTDFFVDTQKGEIHVFERNNRKIHIFDITGRQKRSIKMDIWPYSIGLTSNGNYAAAFDYIESGNGLQLGVYNNEMNVINSLLSIDETHEFVSTTSSFFSSEGILYHVPNLGDSVLVFKNDSVSKVVKIDFGGDFLPHDIVDETNRGNLDKYKSFEGCSNISRYYETSRYVVLSFAKNQMRWNCLIDKVSGKKIFSLNSFVSGVFPGVLYFVKGEYIYWLITQSDVDDYSFVMKADNQNEILKDTHPVIKKILNKGVELPVVLKIKLNG